MGSLRQCVNSPLASWRSAISNPAMTSHRPRSPRLRGRICPLHVLPQRLYIEAEHEEMLVKSEYFVDFCLLHKHKTGAISEGKVLVVVLAEEGFGSSPDGVIDVQYTQRT